MQVDVLKTEIRANYWLIRIANKFGHKRARDSIRYHNQIDTCMLGTALLVSTLKGIILIVAALPGVGCLIAIGASITGLYWSNPYEGLTFAQALPWIALHAGIGLTFVSTLVAGIIFLPGLIAKVKRKIRPTTIPGSSVVVDLYESYRGRLCKIYHVKRKDDEQQG